jgi:hypothetical protein
MVSTWKRLFSSVHRASVIENTLYSCTSTRNGRREFQNNGKREFQNELCVFNEIYSLRTNSNIFDHLSKVVILYSIHPFWFHLHLQYEQIHTIRNTFQFFKNLLHGKRGQDIYYNGFTFCSTAWKLFLVQSSYRWGCTVHGSKGMVVSYCLECKQSFFGWNIFTLIGYSFFSKIRRYFLLQLLLSAAIACFLFLICCRISEWPPCSIENCDSDTSVAGVLSQLTQKNALLLLRFKFTNQSKADSNTCNGLLK